MLSEWVKDPQKRGFVYKTMSKTTTLTSMDSKGRQEQILEIYLSTQEIHFTITEGYKEPIKASMVFDAFGLRNFKQAMQEVLHYISLIEKDAPDIVNKNYDIGSVNGKPYE